MTRFRRILCPIDFSECSREALDWTVELARYHDAHVIALHVRTNWPVAGVIPSLVAEGRSASLKDVDRQTLLRYLQRFVQSRPADRVEIETRVEESPDVHREILAQADRARADLIVLGSHGHSSLERLLLGSTTEKVLRKASCSVMVVPRPGGEAARHDGVHIRRILCPVDFSSSARVALTCAVGLSKDAGADLTVLHVIEIPTALYETPGFEIGPYRASLEGASRSHLHDLVASHTRARRGIDTVVSEGAAAREILRLSDERQCDLIVMGMQGPHAVDRLLFGSTTDHVVRAAACPVLVSRE